MKKIEPSRFLQGWFRVLENKELSPLNYRLIFEAPKIARVVLPGQFVQIGASGCFLKRPFSVCDVRGSKVIVLYKVVGRGTAAMVALRRGDRVDVIGPLGKSFCPTPALFRRIFVAGGVGVPPLYFLARNYPGNRTLDTTFIGARTKNDLLCIGEFKKLGLRVITATEDGSAGHKGFVTGPLGEFLKTLDIMEAKHVIVFTCGPKAMMKAVAMICSRHGITCIASLEEAMACGMGVCMGCVVKVRQDGDFVYQRVCREGPVMETDKILWD